MSGAADWFVCDDGKSFTMNPDQAAKTMNGNPIACNGHVARVWKAHYRQDKQRRDRIWEMLLDAMENLFDAEQGCAADETVLPAARAKYETLIDTLCVLHYGPEGANDENRKQVKSMAEVKYDAEV